jgi:hypothetical protein
MKYAKPGSLRITGGLVTCLRQVCITPIPENPAFEGKWLVLFTLQRNDTKHDTGLGLSPNTTARRGQTRGPNKLNLLKIAKPWTGAEPRSHSTVAKVLELPRKLLKVGSFVAIRAGGTVPQTLRYPRPSLNFFRGSAFER